GLLRVDRDVLAGHVVDVEGDAQILQLGTFDGQRVPASDLKQSLVSVDEESLGDGPWPAAESGFRQASLGGRPDMGRSPAGCAVQHELEPRGELIVWETRVPERVDRIDDPWNAGLAVTCVEHVDSDPDPSGLDVSVKDDPEMRAERVDALVEPPCTVA